MSQALRKLTAVIAHSKTIVIFINQIRMKIGVMFGNPETTPGGNALKFYSSVRLDVRRIAQIKKGEEVVGGRVRVKVVKNKVAAPFRQAEFDLVYNEGISLEGEMLALGEKYGLVQKSGSSYKYGEVALGRGYDAARTFLRETKDVKKKLLAEVQDGAFAKKWIEENEDGRPWFNEIRAAEQTQVLEEVGAGLRALMPFIQPVTIRPDGQGA
jgi:recombination protein RecA